MNLTLSPDNNFILDLNGTSTWVPRLNGVPNLSSLSEPYKSEAQAALTEWLSTGNAIPVPVPPPIILQPDWDNLNNAVLGGSLSPSYNRLTAACFVNPATATIAQIGEANNIAVAAGKIDQAVAYTRIEEALAASFNLLYATSTYRFSAEEIATWNATVTALGFSEVSYLR